MAAAMAAIRTLLHAQGGILAVLLALALAMKALMPAGMMLGTLEKRITVIVCAEGLGTHRTIDLAVPMDQPPAGKQGSKADGPCPYGALGMAGLAGADAIQLGAAFAFILVLGVFAPAPPVPDSGHQLRPPTRGPPLSV